MIIQFLFNRSSSSNYTKVLNLCKKIGALEIGNPNTLSLCIEDVIAKWDVFNSIFHLIKKWSSFELIIDNVSLFDYKSKSDFFYAIQEIKNCIRHYNLTPYKSEYCNSPWGCHKLISISFSQYAWRKWYQYGEWNGNNWIINKEGIYQVLKEESELKHLRACPYFSENKIRDIIDSLPNNIDISKDKNWKIIYKKGFEDGVYKDIRHSIEFQEYKEPVEKKEKEERKPIVLFGGISKLEEEKKLNDYLLYGKEILEDPNNKDNLSDEEADKLIDEWMKKQQNKSEG